MRLGVRTTLTLTLLATTALADDRSACVQDANQELSIAACGRLIANANEPAEIRAIAYANRGSARKRQKDLDAALADFTEAIALNPKLAQAYFNRGVVYFARNDAKHSMEDFTAAIERDPKEPEFFVNRGVLYFELDDHAHAIADLDSAVKLAPKMVLLYTYRGKIHLSAGNADKAAADFKQVLELDPANEEAKAILKDLGQ